MVTLRSLLTKTVSGLVFGGSLLLAYTVVSALRSPPPPRAAIADSTHRPINPFASANGKHLIAFIVTASDCGWSSRPSTMAAIGGIREGLRSTYLGSYARVTVVGIALDQDPRVGYDFLRRIGSGELDRSFDQVVAGGSWLNEAIVRFVWQDQIAEASSPQIVVIERQVATSMYVQTSAIEASGNRVRANPVGSDAILRWVQAGFPLADPPSP